MNSVWTKGMIHYYLCNSYVNDSQVILTIDNKSNLTPCLSRVSSYKAELLIYCTVTPRIFTLYTLTQVGLTNTSQKLHYKLCNECMSQYIDVLVFVNEKILNPKCVRVNSSVALQVYFHLTLCLILIYSI